MAVVDDPAGPCTETEIEYENDEPTDERQLGFYSIADIPSETPLIVKATGDADFWRDIYASNVYIQNDEVEASAAADACDIAAIGRLDGETVSLCWYRARVFAGAVTSLCSGAWAAPRGVLTAVRRAGRPGKPSCRCGGPAAPRRPGPR